MEKVSKIWGTCHSSLPAKFYSWYYPIIIGLVLITGVLSTVYTYKKAVSATQESLLELVSAVANALDPYYIAVLSGSEADLTNSDYFALKERLNKIKKLSRNIRYVYLTGYRGGNPFFFADSEPKSSLGYAPPGLIYKNASPVFRNVFNDKQAVVEDVFFTSRGSWLAALAPIIDPKTGSVAAVLGMDLNARQYYRTIYIYSFLPALAMSFFIFLIAVGYVITKREQRFLSFKSELISIASHEIRTPLTGISWITEGLLSKPESLPEEQRYAIQMIKNQSRNLLLTVNDFLDLSAVEKIKTKKLIKQKIFMRPFLEKIVENFQIALEEKSLNFIFDSSLTSELTVMGDEDRLKRMFNNLISNAIKYSKPNSTIAVGCERREKSFVFWVKDQGIGIPQKDQERVFNGFYRAENAKKITESGTGLGLLYVRQIAELHRGRAWCESKENIGSTFFVEFPKS